MSDDALHVRPGVQIPQSELKLSFSRSGGPGGQNVNTRSTKVEVSFDIAASTAIGPRLKARALEVLAGRLDSEGCLRVVASDARTQAANRTAALHRLAAILADAMAPPPPPRRATRPSRAARERRLESKKRQSRRKQERNWRPD